MSGHPSIFEIRRCCIEIWISRHSWNSAGIKGAHAWSPPVSENPFPTPGPLCTVAGGLHNNHSNHLLLLPVLALLGRGWNPLVVLTGRSSGTYGPTAAGGRETEASSLTRHKGQLSLSRTWQRLVAGRLCSGSAQPQLGDSKSVLRGRHPVTAGKPHDLFQPSLSITLATFCPRAARLRPAHTKRGGH